MAKLNALDEKHPSWLDILVPTVGQVNLSCAIFRNASDTKDDETKERGDNTSILGREILQTYIFKLCDMFLVDFLHLIFIWLLIWHDENNYHVFMICAIDIFSETISRL